MRHSVLLCMVIGHDTLMRWLETRQTYSPPPTQPWTRTLPNPPQQPTSSRATACPTAQQRTSRTVTAYPTASRTTPRAGTACRPARRQPQMRTGGRRPDATPSASAARQRTCWSRSGRGRASGLRTRARCDACLRALPRGGTGSYATRAPCHPTAVLVPALVLPCGPLLQCVAVLNSSSTGKSRPPRLFFVAAH